MRRCLKGNQYLAKLFPRWRFFVGAKQPSFRHADILLIPLCEAFAVEFIQVRDLFRVKEIPVGARSKTAHELIGEKHGGVCRAHAKVVVTRIVLPVQEFRKIVVPILHIETERPLLLAAALNRSDGGIYDFCERSGAAGGGGVCFAEGGQPPPAPR